MSHCLENTSIRHHTDSSETCKRFTEFVSYDLCIIQPDENTTKIVKYQIFLEFSSCCCKVYLMFLKRNNFIQPQTVKVIVTKININIYIYKLRKRDINIKSWYHLQTRFISTLLREETEPNHVTRKAPWWCSGEQ